MPAPVLDRHLDKRKKAPFTILIVEDNPTDVELMLHAHHFVADLDVIGRTWLRAEIGADAAVDGHAPGGDEFIAMSPRSDARRSEIAVQAHVKT